MQSRRLPRACRYRKTILKERSDELLILSKEAQKWAFILNSELRQAELQIGELEKKAAGISPITTEDSKDKYTPNFATIYGVGLRGRNQRKAVLRNDYLKEKKWLSHIGMTRK
jgi:hypothetical protein